MLLKLLKESIYLYTTAWAVQKCHKHVYTDKSQLLEDKPKAIQVQQFAVTRDSIKTSITSFGVAFKTRNVGWNLKWI